MLVNRPQSNIIFIHEAFNLFNCDCSFFLLIDLTEDILRLISFDARAYYFQELVKLFLIHLFITLVAKPSQNDAKI